MNDEFPIDTVIGLTKLQQHGYGTITTDLLYMLKYHHVNINRTDKHDITVVYEWLNNQPFYSSRYMYALYDFWFDNQDLATIFKLHWG